MNKRLFLKLLSILTFGICASPEPILKRYVSQCRWKDLIGIRWEWDEKIAPNPSPGIDWLVFKQAESRFIWKGEVVNNDRMNKFFARPVGRIGPVELVCFGPLIVGRLPGKWGLDIDYNKVDLSRSKFYKV